MGPTYYNENGPRGPWKEGSVKITTPVVSINDMVFVNTTSEVLTPNWPERNISQN